MNVRKYFFRMVERKLEEKTEAGNYFVYHSYPIIHINI